MSKLASILVEQNRWRALMKKPLLSLASAEDRQSLAVTIGFKLDPEVLTCDGECSRSEVNRKYMLLTGALKQLVKIDPSLSLQASEWI